MAIKKGDIAITGTQGGISGYMSHGRNIVRAASSLTAARVKKDPAFAGFRKSSNRMKEASLIAASLYSHIPKKRKEFSLFRLMTGEAIKMIRDGFDKEIIIQTLHYMYIVPVLKSMSMLAESSECSTGLTRYSSQNESNAQHIQSIVAIQSPKEKISSSTSELIYLGKVKGYRKLKIWLRPAD